MAIEILPEHLFHIATLENGENYVLFRVNHHTFFSPDTLCIGIPYMTWVENELTTSMDVNLIALNYTMRHRYWKIKDGKIYSISIVPSPSGTNIVHISDHAVDDFPPTNTEEVTLEF